MVKTRRSFLITATRLSLAIPVVAAGLLTGCDESIPTHAEPDVQKDKEVQDKMKEFMSGKKASKKKS